MSVEKIEESRYVIVMRQNHDVDKDFGHNLFFFLISMYVLIENNLVLSRDMSNSETQKWTQKLSLNLLSWELTTSLIM